MTSWWIGFDSSAPDFFLSLSLFCHFSRGLLAAAKRLSITDHFIWVASDGWGRQHKLVEGLEDVAEGALTVDLESKSMPGFDDYMLSLTPANNQRNPWYGDYWQEVHGCLLPHNAQSTTATGGPPTNGSICPAGLRLTHLGYEQDSKIQFVVDAVYAFAHAISALQRDVCGTPGSGRNGAGRNRVFGACPQLLNYDGGDFYTKYLLNVSFLGEFYISALFRPASWPGIFLGKCGRPAILYVALYRAGRDNDIGPALYWLNKLAAPSMDAKMGQPYPVRMGRLLDRQENIKWPDAS